MTPQERLSILLAASAVLRANPFHPQPEDCGCCYSAEPRTFTHEGRAYTAAYSYDNRHGRCEAVIHRAPRSTGEDYVGALSVYGITGVPGGICHIPLL